MGYYLVLLNGPTPGASIELGDGAETLTIGRDAARDLPIDDQQVSRLHARVSYDGRDWQIEDCGSRNGTQVNSQLVQRMVLGSGDLIRIGDRLIVFLRESGARDWAGLRPSIFARSTCVIRIPAPGNRQTLLQQLRGDLSTRPIRNLSLLCRLATVLAGQGQQRELVREVVDTLEGALEAAEVNVYLIGSDGRLRRWQAGSSSGASPQGVPVEPHEQHGPGHLLASLVVERDEAMLFDTGLRSAEDQCVDGFAQGTAIGVPIPGQGRPRGAIECFTAAAVDARGRRTPTGAPVAELPSGGTSGDGPRQTRTKTFFDSDDLELAIAVAYQFGSVLENLEHRQQLQQANEHLRRRLEKHNRLIGKSTAMKALFDQIGRVARADSTVLVSGESGTGKELVSQTLHQLSRRASGPFVAVNCAALSESLLESELFGHEPGAFTGAERRRLGQFERAHLGTIFLDEVGEMSAACQAKLLRLLEGQPFERLGGSQPVRVDLRIVAATHRDLAELVKAGRFRDDLYYRLRVIELSMQPLRDRGEDILELAVAFLDRFRQEVGRGPHRFSAEAAQAILAYDWPGNVRELKNAVERAVVLGSQEQVLPEDLGLARTAGSAPYRGALASLREAELQHIDSVLTAVGGNKTKACRILGIGRGTLYKKLAGR